MKMSKPINGACSASQMHAKQCKILNQLKSQVYFNSRAPGVEKGSSVVIFSFKRKAGAFVSLYAYDLAYTRAILGGLLR